jgi:hypothetical protein
MGHPYCNAGLIPFVTRAYIPPVLRLDVSPGGVTLEIYAVFRVGFRGAVRDYPPRS